jgi:hypothetical protein
MFLIRLSLTVQVLMKSFSPLALLSLLNFEPFLPTATAAPHSQSFFLLVVAAPIHFGVSRLSPVAVASLFSAAASRSEVRHLLPVGDPIPRAAATCASSSQRDWIKSAITRPINIQKGPI